ncbi:hypothetical protein Droror1_Dr00018874 [Drosera rotundifolia]
MAVKLRVLLIAPFSIAQPHSLHRHTLLTRSRPPLLTALFSSIPWPLPPDSQPLLISFSPRVLSFLSGILLLRRAFSSLSLALPAAFSPSRLLLSIPRRRL